MHNFKYHHIGLPTKMVKENEEYNEKFKFYASGYFDSYYGIEWLRFDKDCKLSKIIQEIPHIGFVVDNILETIKGQKILIEPSSPVDGVKVCFILVNGAPVELLQFDEPEEKIWDNAKKLRIPIEADVNKEFLKIEYDHFGICTDTIQKNEIYLKDYSLFCTDHQNNPFGLQWMRYEKECTLPNLVKTVSHVAFRVDNLDEALKGKKVIIEPNSPSKGVTVAFVEEKGAPIEFLEYK